MIAIPMIYTIEPFIFEKSPEMSKLFIVFAVIASSPGTSSGSMNFSGL